MKLLSLFLLLQMLVLQAAPAAAFLQAEDCCSTACEENPGQHLAAETAQTPSSTECCNPFGCVGCCLLVLPVSEALLEVGAAVATGQGSTKVLEAPAQKSQYSIWHPPRRA